MPYAMKIQPIDFDETEEPSAKCEAVAKQVLRSRFKRLFERPFSSGFRALAPDKPAGIEPVNLEELEPSSVCLGKMVQNFLEENNEKQQQQRCGRNKCICFNGNCTDSSDDERPDSYNSSSSHACDTLKSLVLCVCASEKNLLADTKRIVEQHKIKKRKDGFCRKIVVDGLIALGYDASICKSKWEKSASFLAGEYEYIDVIIEGERLIIDIDFRSEFSIARPTKSYNLALQTLPDVFVGKSDRLERIIGIVSEAAKQSLKKKGMPIPPWRKPDYIKSKWLSPFTRTPISLTSPQTHLMSERNGPLIAKKSTELEKSNSVFVFSNSNSNNNSGGSSCGVGGVAPPLTKWELPEIMPKPKSLNKGVKIVTGLASVIHS